MDKYSYNHVTYHIPTFMLTLTLSMSVISKVHIIYENLLRIYEDFFWVFLNKPMALLVDSTYNNVF